MTIPQDDATYVVNARIVAEVFDDETVLIDVDNGLYFSMQGSAADIWQAFGSARAPEAVCAALGAELGEAERAVIAGVVRDMIANDLLVKAAAGAPPAAALSSLTAASFAVPVLGVFTDLAELIAIDPVHEVDQQAGWPVRPPSFPEVA